MFGRRMRRVSCASALLADLQSSEELQSTIETYSRTTYIDIAHRMQSKLPRELRDMINAQLWDPNLKDHMRPTGNADDLARIFRTKCPGQPCECLKGVILHPWVDLTCVGHATALESAEMIYRLVVGMYADSPEMITQQLYADPFHVGFEPLLVTDTFTIEINIDYCLRKQRRSREAVENKSHTEAYSMLDTMAEAVQHMLKIPRKRDFVLDVTFEQRYIRPNVLNEVLNVFRPIIEALEMEEADINLCFVHHNTRYATDPERTKFVWDLSDVYKCSAEEWQEDLITALDKVSTVEAVLVCEV
jgi:hypothetical protein